MLFSLTKKERKAMSDVLDFGCAIMLVVLIYIGWFALRVAIGVLIAFVLIKLCGWIDLSIDETMMNTVVIGLAGVSMLFPTSKEKD